MLLQDDLDSPLFARFDQSIIGGLGEAKRAESIAESLIEEEGFEGSAGRGEKRSDLIKRFVQIFNVACGLKVDRADSEAEVLYFQASEVSRDVMVVMTGAQHFVTQRIVTSIQHLLLERMRIADEQPELW